MVRRPCDRCAGAWGYGRVLQTALLSSPNERTSIMVPWAMRPIPLCPSFIHPPMNAPRCTKPRSSMFFPTVRITKQPWDPWETLGSGQWYKPPTRWVLHRGFTVLPTGRVLDLSGTCSN